METGCVEEGRGVGGNFAGRRRFGDGREVGRWECGAAESSAVVSSSAVEGSDLTQEPQSI